MKEYIKQAKREGLNWQTLLVEEAQTDIKLAMRDAFIYRQALPTVRGKIAAIIAQVVAELESETLKAKAETSLKRFANVQYALMYEANRRLDFSLVPIAAAIVAGRATTKQRRYFSREIRAAPVEEVYEIAQPLKEYAKTYMQRVERVYDELVESEAKDGYGSPVSLRNVAEMTVRYEYNMEQLDVMRTGGVRLVWINTHANCSKRCEPWQGRLYSLDGTSGSIDGYSFIPIERAMNVYVTTKSGKVYRNGIISGFNCRHQLIPYEKGNKPAKVPAKVVDKQRELNNKQRAYERGIRRAREYALMYRGVDKERYKRYREQAKTIEREYIKFSTDNRLAYYPSRLKVI